MSQTAAHQRYLRVGIILMVAGAALALAAAYAVHLIGLPEKNSFGVEIYPQVPRGWVVTLAAQLASLTGLLVAMGGMTLAFLYKREMTWARASIGAFLFTGLMIILYGVIPNEFLTITQSQLDWSSLKEWVTIPSVLTMGNDISISAAAIKDMIGQGYILTVTAAIAVTMWKWQERSRRLATETPPPQVSKYGRPLTKVER